jgi:hypothetical protein
LIRKIPVEVVLFVDIQKKPTGMAWFSGARSVGLWTMQIGLERGISPIDRFSFGKLKENERCVNPLIVAVRNMGSASYKPLGL